MKSDTERKRYYTEKKHKRRNRLHVHLSKELRKQLKQKRRALLVRKEDHVRVMRGPGMGKEGRVSRVDLLKRKVYVDGVTVNTARGREVSIALEPSNLLLVSLESTDERKAIFSESAFKKPKKAEEKKEEPKAAEHKPLAEGKSEAHTHEAHVHPHAAESHGASALQQSKGEAHAPQAKPAAQASHPSPAKPANTGTKH